MHDDEDEDEDDEEDTDEMPHGDKKKMKKEAYETYGMVKSGMHKQEDEERSRRTSRCR